MFVGAGVSVDARGSRILLFRVPLAFLCALIDKVCLAFINGLRGAFLEIKDWQGWPGGSQQRASEGGIRDLS